jgi:phage baseplate assembly protein W
MIRRDIAFPLRIVGGQASGAPYPAHVGQMVRQVLLTDPGERVCRPTFGAGLRRLLFAPIGVGLDSATELAVRQALDTWLGDQIAVLSVAVTVPSEGRIEIAVVYELIETREKHAQTVELVA